MTSIGNMLISEISYRAPCRLDSEGRIMASSKKRSPDSTQQHLQLKIAIPQGDLLDVKRPQPHQRYTTVVSLKVTLSMRKRAASVETLLNN